MKRLTLSLFSLLSTLTLQADNTLDKLIESHQEMTFDVYRSFTDTNVVYSPYSLFNCLSMVYQGAEGTTKEAMEQTLKLTVSKDALPSLIKSWVSTLADTSNLTVANGMWVKNDFQILPEYTSVIQNDYLANVETVDFSDPEPVAHTINTWVADKTSNMITNFLGSSDLTPMTRLVLVNTVYVNQDWKVPFARTRGDLFWQSEEKSTPVSMMQKQETCPYFDHSLMQIALIPTREENIGCLILLPKPSVTLTEVEETLSSQFFKSSLSSLSPTKLNINMPKFSLTKKIDLNPTLQNLGMGVAFSDDADFSGINGMHNLSIEKVLQQVVFAFSEKGIKAAAATGATIGLTSVMLPGPSQAVPFIANRPFMFFLIDNKSETILFAGKYQGSMNE